MRSHMHFLFLRAFLALIEHDRFLKQHNFADLHGRIREFPVSAREPHPGDIERICEAVAYACIWYTHTVVCLQRSAITVALLRRYGIPAQMVLGTNRLPLKGHAWIEIDGCVISDKPEVQTDYVVIDRC